MIITSLGRDVLGTGMDRLRAQQRIDVGLHPRLERVRSQFMIAEYELGAFAAMREVEIRVRELAAADDSLMGWL